MEGWNIIQFNQYFIMVSKFHFIPLGQNFGVFYLLCALM